MDKRIVELAIMGQEIDIPQDILPLRKLLQESQKEIKKIRRNSRSNRDKYLEELAAEMSKQGDLSKCKILKRILNMEAMSTKWKNIDRARGKRTSKGFTKIQVPSSWPQDAEGFAQDIENPKKCDEWRTVDNPEDIEFYVQMRNRKHFGQASGTLFTKPPRR